MADEKIINELNERILAQNMVLRLVVGVLSNLPGPQKDIFKMGIEKHLDDLPAEYQTPTIKGVLNEYLDLVNSPSPGGKPPNLRLL